MILNEECHATDSVEERIRPRAPASKGAPRAMAGRARARTGLDRETIVQDIVMRSYPGYWQTRNMCRVCRVCFRRWANLGCEGVEMEAQAVELQIQAGKHSGDPCYGSPRRRYF